MDYFEYRYEDPLIKVEADMDFDNQIDVRSHVEWGLNIRDEYFDKNGRLSKIVDYDEAGKKLKAGMDTNGDGQFNVLWHYIEGKHTSSTMDTDYDGKINAWEILKMRYLLNRRWMMETTFWITLHDTIPKGFPFLKVWILIRMG